jgi:hypothetical protein
MEFIATIVGRLDVNAWRNKRKYLKNRKILNSLQLKSINNYERVEEKRSEFYIAKKLKNKMSKCDLTRKGFMLLISGKRWKLQKSNKEALDTVNENYHELFGNYRYSDWNSQNDNYYNNQKKIKWK